MNKTYENYFLTSPRLGFRLWQENDIDLAINLWGNQKVTEFIDAQEQLTKSQIKEKLKEQIEIAKSSGVQYWPIFFLENNKHVGCCGLRPYKKIFEIGFHICQEHWGQGYAREAATTVIEYAFSKLKAKSIFAGHNPKNTASEYLLKKLGFEYTHKQFYPPTGLNHPSYLLTKEVYTKNK